MILLQSAAGAIAAALAADAANHRNDTTRYVVNTMNKTALTEFDIFFHDWILPIVMILCVVFLLIAAYQNRDRWM